MSFTESQMTQLQALLQTFVSGEAQSRAGDPDFVDPSVDNPDPAPSGPEPQATTGLTQTAALTDDTTVSDKRGEGDAAEVEGAEAPLEQGLDMRIGTLETLCADLARRLDLLSTDFAKVSRVVEIVNTDEVPSAPSAAPGRLNRDGILGVSIGNFV